MNGLTKKRPVLYFYLSFQHGKANGTKTITSRFFRVERDKNHSMMHPPPLKNKKNPQQKKINFSQFQANITEETVKHLLCFKSLIIGRVCKSFQIRLLPMHDISLISTTTKYHVLSS